MEYSAVGWVPPRTPEVTLESERIGSTFEDALTSREFGTDLRALPNQCGKPCRKLNPPGGSRSSSVALTVSVSADPVV